MRTPEEQASYENRAIEECAARADLYEGVAGWFYDARCGTDPTSRDNKAHYMEPWRCSLRESGTTMSYAKKPSWMWNREDADFRYWQGTLMWSPLCARQSRREDRWNVQIEPAPEGMPKCKHCLKKRVSNAK